MGITQDTPTRNQLFTQYDTSKIFLFDNIYQNVIIPNTSGSDLVIPAGTVIGVVDTTYQVFKSGTANISLIGVIAESITIADEDEATVAVCIGGKVDEEKLIFDGSDDLDTVISNRTIRDRLASDTLGIELAAGDELTVDDNS